MTTYPCLERPDLFISPDGERHNSPEYHRRVNAARARCLDCPIMIACRDRGRELHEPGIWGGETDEERAAAGFPTPETLKHQHRRSHKARARKKAAA